MFQAVLKQFGASGYGGSDSVGDGPEFQQHQKLEKLYISTRAAKVSCSSILISMFVFKMLDEDVKACESIIPQCHNLHASQS